MRSSASRSLARLTYGAQLPVKHLAWVLGATWGLRAAIVQFDL